MCIYCSAFNAHPYDASLGIIGLRQAEISNPINALLHGYNWSGAWNTPASVSYSYSMATGATDYAGLASPSVLKVEHYQPVTQAFQAWSNVANVTFSSSSGTSDINIRMADLPSGVAAWTGIDATGTTRLNHADVVLDHQYNDTIKLGNYAFQTVLHEIGHAIGLKHPGNYDAAGKAKGPFLPSSLDNWDSSIMSYHQGSNANMTHIPITPMFYDIKAAQALYGANTGYNAGDTYYKVTGEAYAMTYWDGGGIDTLDLSSLASSNNVDLREGIENVSNMGEMRAWMAAGTNIENVIGGAGNDVVFGNPLSNSITGGGGSDVLYGGKNNDTLAGQGGQDILYGNLGNDTLTGGSDHDLLYGGQQNDDLMAGEGNDTLVGGLGNDRFLVISGMGNTVIVDFQKGTDMLGVSRTILDQPASLLQQIAYGDDGAVLRLAAGGSVTLIGFNQPLDSSDIVLI